LDNNVKLMNRILVIDDEDMLRQTVVEVLRQSGYSVLEAENGEKGLALAQSQPFDLIISDIMMDTMDGFKVMERVRADQAISTTPFIFMTGVSDRETMRRGMSLGADDFLTKPFTGSELLAAVEVRLSKHSDLLEKAEQKLSELRSSISLALPHEIRTPLSGILGFAEIIGDESSSLSASERADFGKMIYRAAQRLQRLLENFLIYAQIEVVTTDPKKVASLRKSEFHNTAEAIRHLSRDKAEAYNRLTDLTLEVFESPVAISADYLKKICAELVDNAFKFSQAGSQVLVNASANNGEFVLTITDNGRGLSPQQIAGMGAYMQFERKFYEQQGAGLGLMIAKRLAELHGGRIELAATPGGGLTVRVFLPVHAS
jgi:two-component system sensor histidine kinase/response regulator